MALFRTNICIVRNVTRNPGHILDIDGTIPDKLGTIPDKAGTIPDKAGTIPDKAGNRSIEWCRQLRSFADHAFLIIIGLLYTLFSIRNHFIRNQGSEGQKFKKLVG